MAQLHERMFYEVMWRIEGRGRLLPLPWWLQQYFRHWVESFDGGLFGSKEAALSSNAHYRYWNMVGVEDHRQESLVGQAGEIEPVYDQYAVSFFLFDPTTRKLHFPQFAGLDGNASYLNQELEDGYLPVVMTTYGSSMGIEVNEKVIATTVGVDQRSVVVVRLKASLSGSNPVSAWLCLSVSAIGLSGFQRHDRAGRYIADRRLSFQRYLPAEQRVEINSSWGPIFDIAPAHFGLYGNKNALDPNFYLDNNAYQDLLSHGALNGQDIATDYVAGLCLGVYAWPSNLTPANHVFSTDI